MSLKVVGAGLGRTGTASLQLALERLTGGRCYHMFELMKRTEAVPVWHRAVRGEPVDWMAAYERHAAAVREGVPRKRLVEWQPGDGWGPLCAGLGLVVPAQPFPEENSSGEFRGNIERHTGR
ncbi:MAG TPA: sulfotransferase [Solirubrobacteraceae bacterium]|nr:sulfotransferase [Solirubrobacteraceae bacterium]